MINKITFLLKNLAIWDLLFFMDLKLLVVYNERVHKKCAKLNLSIEKIVYVSVIFSKLNS